MACLLVLCSCFTFVACGKNDDNNAKVNEANYTVLKTSSAKMANVNNFGNGVTAITEEKTSIGATIDRDASDMTAAEADALDANFASVFETLGERGRSILSYDRTNQKGYHISQQQVVEGEGETKTTSWNNSNASYFEKVGDAFYVYESDDENGCYKYTADANYYRNYSQDLEEMFEEFAEMFNVYDTYAALVQDVSSSMLEDFNIMGVTPSASVSITEKNGVYTLAVAIDATAPTMNVGGTPVTNLVIDVDGSVVFDKDKVSSVNVRLGISAKMVVDASEMFSDDGLDGSSPSDTANPDDGTSGSSTPSTLPLNFSASEEMTFTFTEGYTEEYKPTIDTAAAIDLGGYEFSIDLHIDGYEYTRITATTGATVDLSELQNEVIGASNPTSIKWYIDEACTQEFDATTYSSYDLDLYTKNVTLDTGYAYVRRVTFYAGDFVGSIPSAAEIAEQLADRNSIATMETTLIANENTTYILNGVPQTGSTITLNPEIVNILVEIRSEM